MGVSRSTTTLAWAWMMLQLYVDTPSGNVTLPTPT
jgi:hypothetical protein